jgi:hypothetical protein
VTTRRTHDERSRRSGRTLALYALLGAACGGDATEPAGSDPEATAGDAAGDGGTAGDDADADGSDAADGETDGADQEPWEPGGPGGECAVDELVPAHVHVRRVKMLLTGEATTDAEVAAVMADPDALHELVATWVETEAFRGKMMLFLRTALQQSVGGARDEYASQVNNDDGIQNFRPPDQIYRNLDDSFVHTALAIIDEGRPWNEIASTRTWMMTTAMLSYVLVSEKPTWGQTRYYRDAVTIGGTNYTASTPLGVQIANRVFYVPTLPACSDDPLVVNQNDRNFTMAMGGETGPNNCKTQMPSIFQASDYEDWRPVTLTTLPEGEDVQPFWDAPALRQLDTVGLRSSKAGFFSTPAFLAGWRTNVDNSFRVTTNQALIVGLGLAFEDTDVTIPLGDEGLSDAHAEPGTQCYGCHKNLDPMRNFFDNVYYPDTYAVRALADVPGLQPSFSFQGHTAEGQTLADLGAIIAEHPAFAAGWAQKLCYFANGQACNAEDPEFSRVVDAFEGSNLDFKTLVVELFSSRLVTDAACPDGMPMAPVPTSVARREHLCHALEVRLGMDACGSSTVAVSLSDALPSDSWSRGSTVPNQPAQSSLFYSATTESLCRQIGNSVVDAEGSPLQSNDMDAAVGVLVHDVLGLVPSDPRHDLVQTILTEHVQDAAEITTTAKTQLVSAFTLACSSPYFTTTDL